jgi:patatin-like phospholipase/acyl hydrolase
MADVFRVLAVDGGGIRGYIPALVLAEIEKRAKMPAAKLFDLIVGTSTGGIIGIGVAAGMSADELARFYPDYGRRIFGGVDRPAWQKRVMGYGATFGESMGQPARKFGAPWGGNKKFGGNARHRANGLEGVLQDVLGERRLSEVAVPLAVTSFDGVTSQPVVFSSRDAQRDGALDLPLRVAARATSAAPTYFPPCEYEWAGRICKFIDGGVWANNPSAVALSEAAALTTARQITATSILLVSLGTGIAPSGATFNETATWIGAASDTIKTATSVVAGEVLARRALPPSNFVRLQVVDESVAGAMDDPAPARLAVLKNAADQLAKAEEAQLERLAALLVGGVT